MVVSEPLSVHHTIPYQAYISALKRDVMFTSHENNARTLHVLSELVRLPKTSSPQGNTSHIIRPDRSFLGNVRQYYYSPCSPRSRDLVIRRLRVPLQQPLNLLKFTYAHKHVYDIGAPAILTWPAKEKREKRLDDVGSWCVRHSIK